MDAAESEADTERRKGSRVEAVTSGILRANQLLSSPIIANRFTGFCDTTCDSGIANDLTGPQLCDQFVPRHETIAQANKVRERLKHFGFDLDGISSSKQDIMCRIEYVVAKDILHG